MCDKECECYSKCVTKEEFIELRDVVVDLAKHVNHLTTTMDTSMTTLIKALTGNTPSRSVPIETHMAVVKGLIVAFTVVMLATEGAPAAISLFIGK